MPRSTGSSLIMPYVATLDLDLESDLMRNERDLLMYFRGGCGHPDPSVRGLFAAGKMLRYDFVHSIQSERQASDIDIKCSCDICDNHTPHAEVMAGYRRSRFLPHTGGPTSSRADDSARPSYLGAYLCLSALHSTPCLCTWTWTTARWASL